MVAVPPGLLLVLPPQGFGLHRVFADQIRRHALDDRLGSEIGLGKLRDRLAPTDLPVVRRDLGEAQMSKRVEVVRLGITDGNGLDLGDLHDFRPFAISPRNGVMPSTPTSTLMRRPVIAAPRDVEWTHVAAIEQAALAERAIQDRAAGLQEIERLAVPVDDVDAAGSDRGDPEITLGVDLQAVGNMPLRHFVDDAACGRRACAERLSACRIRPTRSSRRVRRRCRWDKHERVPRGCGASPFFSTTTMRPGCGFVSGAQSPESVK